MQDNTERGEVTPTHNTTGQSSATQVAAPRRGYRRHMALDEEAGVIFRALHREFGARSNPEHRLIPARVIQGTHAIIRMLRARYYAWRENEWPAYYVAFRLRRLLANTALCRVKDRRRVLYRGQSTWNVRLHCTHDIDQVILGDVGETNANFNSGGFGLIVLEAQATYDVQGTLRQWHDQLKGGPSEYTRRVTAEGRRHSKRKAAFSLVKGTAYFFPTLMDFRVGVTAGWLNDCFGLNMREPNGDKRPRPKYLISVGHIPWRFRVAAHDFNATITDHQKLNEKEVKTNG